MGLIGKAHLGRIKPSSYDDGKPNLGEGREATCTTWSGRWWSGAVVVMMVGWFHYDNDKIMVMVMMADAWR